MPRIDDNFIKAIELLPYDIDEAVKFKDTVTILKDVTQKYVETFCDSLYNLYVLLNIAKGVHEINKDNGITLENFSAEREALYESYSRKRLQTRF